MADPEAGLSLWGRCGPDPWTRPSRAIPRRPRVPSPGPPGSLRHNGGRPSFPAPPGMLRIPGCGTSPLLRALSQELVALLADRPSPC